jgi:hypothetical protein
MTRPSNFSLSSQRFAPPLKMGVKVLDLKGVHIATFAKMWDSEAVI